MVCVSYNNGDIIQIKMRDRDRMIPINTADVLHDPPTVRTDTDTDVV